MRYFGQAAILVPPDWKVRRGFEAPTFVPGLDDIAVVSEPVEQGRGHFGVPEHVSAIRRA